MTNHEATVFVLDDDQSVRNGVARMLRAAGYSARTFASPRRFLQEPLPDGPACVILDMMLDELDGLGVQQELRQRGRDIPIVFLSGHSDIPMAAKALKSGAEDFLVKPFEPKDLMGAIRRAVEHDRKSSAARASRGELKRRYETVTEREREVMAMVVRGMLNKQVAAELGIAEKTVKVHRARAMEKMQVESLAELVRVAQLFEPEVRDTDKPQSMPSSAVAGRL